MKKQSILFLAFCVLFLTGCVSGARMVRNSPFDGGKFYREGVNMWPLYYQEGVRRSILFPLIDMDDRGFAVRPFYHKDRDEHGILWPLIAFNSHEGWAGTFYWKENGSFGLWPFFSKRKDLLWIFPATWYGKDSYGVLPFFCRNDDTVWIFPANWYSQKSQGALPFYWRCDDKLLIGNVFKSKDMFLVFPLFGKGKDWIYLLNFIHCSRRKEKGFIFLPLVWYLKNEFSEEKTFLLLPLCYVSASPDNDMFLSPLFSFRRREGKLTTLNIALLLYHYSGGNHYVFYPFANADFQEESQEFWLWPLVNYTVNDRNWAPLFLFEYQKSDHNKHTEFNILRPLLFQYKHYKGIKEKTVKILPEGILWKSTVTPYRSSHRFLGGTLWNSSAEEKNFKQTILGGAVYRNSRSENSRRFSLLYKFFSYHRFKNDVKWEFFPFVKVMETSKGRSWSFAWRLLEKHDGGGHIFFIPWGKGQRK